MRKSSMKMKKNRCQVCEINDSYKTTYSPLGTVSFAYCKKCFDNMAEPFAVLKTYWNKRKKHINLEHLSTFHNGEYMTFTEARKYF